MELPAQLRQAVDAALAGQVLGWRPTVSLTEGIAKTAEWFAEQTKTG